MKKKSAGIIMIILVGVLSGAPSFSQEEEEEGLNINLWPLVVSSRSEDGTRTLWATPLFHYTRHADGSANFHIVNYVQGKDFWAFIPLAYSSGEPGKKHVGVIPFFFSGPGYCIIPPLLFLLLELEGGAQTLWITPLFHLTWDESGRRWLHAATYFEGPDYRILFPLAYEVDTAKGTYRGVVPLFFQGPATLIIPPLLALGWIRGDGGRTFWITPLFHHTRDGSGGTGFHFLNYFQGDDYWCFFPLAFAFGPPEERCLGILPFYVRSRDGTFFPILFSGAWQWGDGSRSLWITPLFHHHEDGDGKEWLHCLTYFQGPGYQVLFPLAYWSGPPGNRYVGIIPFYFKGPSSTLVPPLLSGAWDHWDGGRSLWITPLFHHRTDGEGNAWLHCLTYFQGPGYKVLFPLAFLTGEEGDRTLGLVPLYFRSPEHLIIPPLLTWRYEREDGGRTLWVTPFFHHTRDAAGRGWLHVLNYFQGPDYKVLFPLAYVSDGKETRRFGIVPLFFKGESSWCAPLLLSGGRDQGPGGRTTWITPFFHHARDSRGDVSFHLFNYFQGPDYKVLFPLAYVSGGKESRRFGIVPFYFKGEKSWFAPPLLSAGWERKDGGKSLWITPLFHHTRDGSDHQWFHILNYFQGPDTWFLFPLAYGRKGPAGSSFGIIPLYFQGAESAYAPLLLSGSWTREDGGRTTWITPLFHQSRDANGGLEGRHLLNWFQGPDYRVLFPVYWNWKNENGASHTLIPPLYWRRSDPTGERSWSLLWPLTQFRSGARLDTSLPVQLKPILYQEAGEDYEFNFLWRLFHLRRQEGASRFTLGPLWWSERPRPGTPKEYQILGGLFARDCDYPEETYRHRIFWFFPIGPETPF